MLSQTSLSFSDYLENKPFVIGQELSTKLHCIRFIIGLHEHRPTDSQFSQSSTYSSSTEDENESRLLGHGCLNYFDKITGIYPFSDVEKSHMRSALKLQVLKPSIVYFKWSFSVNHPTTLPFVSFIQVWCNWPFRSCVGNWGEFQI